MMNINFDVQIHVEKKFETLYNQICRRLYLIFKVKDLQITLKLTCKDSKHVSMTERNELSIEISRNQYSQLMLLYVILPGIREMKYWKERYSIDILKTCKW